MLFLFFYITKLYTHNNTVIKKMEIEMMEMDYRNRNQPLSEPIDQELIDYWHKLTHRPTVIVCKYM